MWNALWRKISMCPHLYSLNGKTSYRQIWWCLAAARLDVMMIVSLWSLAAALLSRYLSHLEAIRKVQPRISQLRDFSRCCGKTSVRLVNRGPGDHLWILWRRMRNPDTINSLSISLPLPIFWWSISSCRGRVCHLSCIGMDLSYFYRLHMFLFLMITLSQIVWLNKC